MLHAPDGSEAAALPALPLVARRWPSRSDTPRPSPPPEGVVSGAACAPSPGQFHSFFGSGVARALGSGSGDAAPETAPHARRAALGAAVSPAALLDDVEVELADALLSAGPPSTSVALGGAVRGGATPGAKAEPIAAVRALALFAGSRWPAPPLPLPLLLPPPLPPLPPLPLLLLPLLGVASEFCPAPLTKLP